MWRLVRIGALLFILAVVAKGAWVDRSRTAEWKTSLRVAIYPVGTDPLATSYVSDLRKTKFDPIEAFFRLEGKRYGVSLPDPVVTTTSTWPPAWFGVTARSSPMETCVMLVADEPPNVTVAWPRLAPVMVTVVPPSTLPLEGEIVQMTGLAMGGCPFAKR